ncbi:MAG: tyrosine-type recombinase/integrase [Verrucomicrobiota bacterium]
MNTDIPANTGVHSKSGRKVAGLEKCQASFAKTDQRFWLQPGRLFKEKGAAAYSCRIQFGGDRLRFGLSSSNQAAAAAKAAGIYQSLTTVGKEATLAKFKPKAEEKADVSTVGGWIDAVETHCPLFPATLQNYVSAARKLAGDIAMLPRNKSRFSYKDGGTAAWRALVDKIPLALLDSAQVNAWQVAYRKSKPANPEAQRKAMNSARSTVRNAKALFGVKIAKALRDVAGLSLPEPLPMADVSLTELFGKKTKSRYQSRIDAKKLLQEAGKGLVKTHPEAYKVLLLALCCGLRKREIDCLLWKQVDLDQGTIRIEATEHFRPKTEDSAGDLDLDPQLVALLRQWKKAATGDFVIEGREATEFKSRVSYRCETVYTPLYEWLRKHGVTAQKALHELRKEAGALVAQAGGIYAASRLLRHSDIRVTADFYADKKEGITTGLGAMLTSSKVVDFPKPAAARKAKAKAKGTKA